MKDLIVNLAASLAVVSGAQAQGSFDLENEVAPAGGFVVDRPGNWYSGPFGMEVWMLNGTSIPAGVNLSRAPGSGVLGYSAMVAAGFVKEATYANQTTAFPGAFDIGEVDMPDEFPPGVTVVVALAAWNTGAPSWGAMLADANQATRAGIVAFLQPTVNFTVGGALPPNLAMSQDLVLSAIPEPSGLALTGLGGLLLLLLHRRRQRALWMRRRSR